MAGHPAWPSFWSATTLPPRFTSGNKLKAGGEAGFRADLQRLPANATLADTLALVERLNESPVHDGILVQSPLPKAMGADAHPARVRYHRTGEGR